MQVITDQIQHKNFVAGNYQTTANPKTIFDDHLLEKHIISPEKSHP